MLLSWLYLALLFAGTEMLLSLIRPGRDMSELKHKGQSEEFDRPSYDLSTSSFHNQSMEDVQSLSEEITLVRQRKRWSSYCAETKALA